MRRPALSPALASGRRRLARFARAEGGASALEFTIVAIPFLFLLLASFELCLIFAANVGLQDATFAAARELRVGVLSAQGVSQTSSSGTQIDLADFKTRMCKAMPLTGGGSCTSNLYVDVRQLSSSSNPLPASPYSGSALDARNFCFSSGGSGSLIELRAYYTWPVFTPLLLNALINTKSVVTSASSSSGQWFGLSSHEVFRNEPGSSTNNSGASC